MIVVFWIVMPCSKISGVYQSLTGMYYLNSEDKGNVFL